MGLCVLLCVTFRMTFRRGNQKDTLHTDTLSPRELPLPCTLLLSLAGCLAFAGTSFTPVTAYHVQLTNQ